MDGDSLTGRRHQLPEETADFKTPQLINPSIPQLINSNTPQLFNPSIPGGGARTRPNPNFFSRLAPIFFSHPGGGFLQDLGSPEPFPVGSQFAPSLTSLVPCRHREHGAPGRESHHDLRVQFLPRLLRGPEGTGNPPGASSGSVPSGIFPPGIFLGFFLLEFFLSLRSHARFSSSHGRCRSGRGSGTAPGWLRRG